MQLVVVEDRHHLRVQLLDQVRGQQPAGLPGVDEAVELVHQDGPVTGQPFEDVLVHRVELSGVQHGNQPTQPADNRGRPPRIESQAALSRRADDGRRRWPIITRFSETGTFVRRFWANRLTRSSSSSQPIASEVLGQRTRAGRGRRRAAYASSQRPITSAAACVAAGAATSAVSRCSAADR